MFHGFLVFPLVRDLESHCSWVAWNENLAGLADSVKDKTKTNVLHAPPLPPIQSLKGSAFICVCGEIESRDLATRLPRPASRLLRAVCAYIFRGVFCPCVCVSVNFFHAARRSHPRGLCFA